MERTKNIDKNGLKKASFWFCGKAMDELKVTVRIGGLSCFKEKM
jgi:hypothetical protein